MCICKIYIFFLLTFEMYVTLVLSFSELIKSEVVKLWSICSQNIYFILFFKLLYLACSQIFLNILMEFDMLI